MKRSTTFAFLLLLVCVSAALAGAQRRGASTISYDEKFSWDKRVFDSPPSVVGGQAAFVPWLEYPTSLRRERIQGRSLVSVIVDASGAVTRISFSPRMHPDLERLVTQAVKKCRWKPGRKRGKVVAGSVSFPVTFILTKP
jgi:TonB family protein